MTTSYSEAPVESSIHQLRHIETEKEKFLGNKIK
jgi:hypothetical protein